MKLLYLDSSLIVALAADDPKRGARVMSMIQKFDAVGTSELAIVEGQSGLSAQFANAPTERLKAEENLNRILAGMTLYTVGSLVLGSARSLVKRYRSVTGLRAMDAIHIATAGLIREAGQGTDLETLEYATADRRQHETFVAEGYLGELVE